MKRIIVVLFLATLPSILLAQNGPVTGKVTGSDDGEGIPGVTVVEKGTTNGIVTDIDGNYSIQLKSTSATLVFSMVGMLAQEKAVKQGSIVDVVLKSDTKMLDQVVVTGYSTQKRADLTGAVSVISVSDMMSEAENNPMKALQGRVAGMSVSSDGSPSGSAKVLIRGISTLPGGDTDPLYVIDGVPTKAGMHELNSNDIENIQVLKDASSASIYGSRAANGVIIITTKKGKQGKIRLNFDSYLTQTQYSSKLEVLNAKEYGQAKWQAAVNSGRNPNTSTNLYVYDWGYNANGKAVLNGMMLPKYIDAAYTMPTSDTNWFDEVSQKGLAQSYNLSLSNGTENGNYFFSLGYYDNQGMIKESDFSRVSARMNADYKLFNNILTIGENFTLNKTSEVQMPGEVLDLAFKALPIIPVHANNGNWGGPVLNKDMNDRQNPVRILNDNKNNAYEYWRMFGNAYVNLEPIKKLNIRSSFGIDYANFYKRYMQHSYHSGASNSNSLNSDFNGVYMEQAHWQRWTWSNTVSYEKEIGKNRFDGLIGVEMNKSKDINFSAGQSGDNAFAVETPEYMWPDMGTGKATSTGGSTGYALLSYFGKINYVYDNRYLASATLRYDGSSRFGKNNRFGTFPAFSFGWRISEEAFMKDTRNVVSDLKLRLGWGQTGNQEISDRAVYTIYVPDYGTADPTWNVVNGTAYDLSGKGSGNLPSGFKRTQTGNDDLKWETSTQTNIGLDFGFLDQKIYGSAEYYIKETNDLLTKPAYLAVIGEGGDHYVNGASMQNKGFEFTIGFRNSTSYGLTYDFSGNISTNKNKVTKLPDEVVNSYGGNGTTDNILGRPIGSFYGYVADGLFRTQEDIDTHVKQEGKELGRIRYKNLDDDNAITDADRTWIGSPFPDFAYGLNMNFGYKDFDLTIFFQGVQGIKVENWLKKQTDFWSLDDINSNKGTRLLNAWSPSNPDSDIPALQAVDTNNEGRFSSYYIEDGSYLKLRNLQLGYTLPKHISLKAKMEKVRFYLSGQNLFTIKSSGFTGVDPENVGFAYPIPTTYTFGLNVSF